MLIDTAGLDYIPTCVTIVRAQTLYIDPTVSSPEWVGCFATIRGCRCIRVRHTVATAGTSERDLSVEGAVVPERCMSTRIEVLFGP